MGPLFDYLNVNNKNMSFKGLAASRDICYLDVFLTGNGPGIETFLYRKPLSGNTLLRAQSGHSRHILKGIPMGQFLPFRHICSSESQFDKEAKLLYRWFLDREYPKWILDWALRIARGKKRDDLLNLKNNKVDLHKNKLTHSTLFSAVWPGKGDNK